MEPDLAAGLPLGLSLSIPAASRALLIGAGAALALIVAFPPMRTERRMLLVWGLGGIVGIAAIALAPTLDIVILAVMAIALAQSAAGGKRPLAVRLRGPAIGVALLGVALLLARAEGSQLLDRFAAIGLVAGLAAGLGVLPYVHRFDADELTGASPIAWLAFVGPLLTLAVVTRVGELVPSAGGVFSAMLIGIGLLNVVWGCLASWHSENGPAAWHYSFMADWGLVFCAFGLGVTEGRGAAILVLYCLLIGRLPLYLWSRPALRERTQTDRPVNLLAAAMLAGSAPFAGFAARVLLLRAATQVYWPLALVIAAGLLLWLPSSLRLGRSLGMPKGRQLVGVAIALVLNLAIGLYPQPILALAGL